MITIVEGQLYTYIHWDEVVFLNHFSYVPGIHWERELGALNSLNILFREDDSVFFSFSLVLICWFIGALLRFKTYCLFCNFRWTALDQQFVLLEALRPCRCLGPRSTCQSEHSQRRCVKDEKRPIGVVRHEQTRVLQSYPVRRCLGTLLTHNPKLLAEGIGA